MTAVGQAIIIEPRPGRRIIHTYGMRALSRALTTVSYGEITKVYAKAIKTAAEPIAETARAMAPVRTGEFAASIAIRGGRSGASLAAKDVAAGVIEYAGPADELGRGLTAAWGPPARALWPAIDKHIDQVAVATSAAVEATFQALVSKDWTVYPDP